MVDAHSTFDLANVSITFWCMWKGERQRSSFRNPRFRLALAVMLCIEADHFSCDVNAMPKYSYM